MDGSTDYRQAIAYYLRSLADWRRRKAEEYDRDARNYRSAAALDELATYVVELPITDARVTRLRALSETRQTFSPGQQAAYEIGRFRFFSEEAHLDPFLDRIVELAEADAAERGRFGGRMAPGDDPWR